MGTSNATRRACAVSRRDRGRETAGPLELASGVPINVQRAIDTIEASDIVIVPSVLLRPGGWEKGRYPAAGRVAAARCTTRGAVLCSACSGIFLLAETGLFDGKDATVHFGYARRFAAAYPAVPIHPERVLVISGLREELVSSGASTTWHDMVLYLIARYAGVDRRAGGRAHVRAAMAPGRAHALHHFRGQERPRRRRYPGRAAVVERPFLGRQPGGGDDQAIEARRTHLQAALRRTRPASTPIAYVQRLRIEDAKRRLERTDASVDEISWRVGYEDPAFFRRLFKRTTGLAPGAYRKRFRIPEFARS